MSPMAARITNMALRTPLRSPYSAFSTTARSRAGAGKSTNGSKPDDVEIPAFNIRHITSSPRARFWLISGFCVLASIEGYGWYNFGPKILGWEKGEEEAESK
ncbi:hypothetical protein CGCF415_v003264 [Colletotrichum fructicola]|uniref:Uncharacterized protein n=1 Tax=Colletotrichum fructicola (strain Nara gc5) TaxID=1213859 RepID=L2FFS0_COLFN|nr:uncharacterized protein CGMCC3_g7810 [Colletotrichum fructicola]KAF4491496.1 hypothetical protein CGGC5_v002275 [Colletotrichum fructicola Nara gc5]KAE9576012.1 hypothetical protein CGMCC3_g7810 [Colletotrichum fructicola]KAF4426832.1 hypothetical protein CFRS1_v003099 [Colletotrichum fructicola]KAF4899686.1 hypothetical protein CGCFRS4_v003633 [Colletotrichum fructicola]KAF4913096.1 hypothetical protein CGCF415_v003264 [Colletotrichum fructicola]